MGDEALGVRTLAQKLNLLKEDCPEKVFLELQEN